MSLVVYNTLSGRKEPFTPIEPPKVGMYVCGVTVYDLCHIGHARAGIVFDVISRYLRYSGYDVTFVRNITDIDDKIIKKANDTGGSWDEIAGKYTAEFDHDMNAIGLSKPEVEPKATEHIDEMLEMIKTLVDKGHAYESSGSVWFSVKDFAPYGVLSNRNIEELMAGARVDPDETKRDPLDFCLWKASKPGEPTWDSAWGPGRPGWHIECSAMGRKYLGETFDIHGGGKDLVFPHHENEIAQSHASSGKAPVKYWIHNGFVSVNKEKMSKSLGNFFTIQDLLKIHHAESLRFFLLSSHYRSPIDFADDYLQDAYKNVLRFYDFLLFAESLDVDTPETEESDNIKLKFAECMDDDFNTATALAELGLELKRLNQLRLKISRLKKKSDDFKACAKEIVAGANQFRRLGKVLGLFGSNPAEFIESAKAKKLEELEMSREELEGQISARESARKRKDFITSDRIRDELLRNGILLMDRPDKTDWTMKID